MPFLFREIWPRIRFPKLLVNFQVLASSKIKLVKMSVLLLFMFIKYLLADELGRFFLDNLVLPDKIENNATKKILYLKTDPKKKFSVST